MSLCCQIYVVVSFGWNPISNVESVRTKTLISEMWRKKIRHGVLVWGNQGLIHKENKVANKPEKVKGQIKNFNKKVLKLFNVIL